MVCLQCSLYYSRRFCVKCVRKYREEFPPELKKEITRLDDRYREIKEKKKNAEISAGINSQKSEKSEKITLEMPFLNEIRCMMFVNGDVDQPIEATARLLEVKGQKLIELGCPRKVTFQIYEQGLDRAKQKGTFDFSENHNTVR